MPDLTDFNPANAAELLDAIIEGVSTEASDWWTKNSALMEGYVRALAEASMQTAAALREGRLSAEQADAAFYEQKLAFESTLRFSKLMTLSLAQRIVDSVFRVIGWAVLNGTGVNVAPHLVRPDEG